MSENILKSQRTLETEMKDMGQKRYRTEIEKAIKNGRESVTPYGVGFLNAFMVPTTNKVKELIGVQLQANEYFDHLTLSDLLTLFSRLFQRDENPKDLLAKVNLEEKAEAKPAALSGGQKQRFSIASALVNEPKVLFLDEPTTGLDPQAKRNLWRLVEDLNAAGMTIVLTTHNMEEAEHLCGRIAIMDHGRVIAEGSPQDLILEHAPDPPEARLHGNLEDVFLKLTGHGLRE